MQDYKKYFHKNYNNKLSSNFRYYSKFFNYETKKSSTPPQLKELNIKLFSEIKNLVPDIQIEKDKLIKYINKVESNNKEQPWLVGINWWKTPNKTIEYKITGIIINNLDMLSKNFNSHKRTKFRKPNEPDENSKKNIVEKINKQITMSGVQLVTTEQFDKYIKEKIVGKCKIQNEILNIWMTYIICAKLIKENKAYDFSSILDTVKK